MLFSTAGLDAWAGSSIRSNSESEVLKAKRVRFVIKAAYRLNSGLHSLGLVRLGSVRKLKGVLTRLLYHMIFGDNHLVLAEVERQPMFVPASFLSHYVVHRVEPLTTARFCASIRRGSVVFDVGAHIGFYSLLAARAVGPEGRVFAFEPHPENFAVLEQNIRLNHYSNICAQCCAVSTHDSPRLLILSESSDCHSFYPHPLRHATSRTCLVNCATLDTVCECGGPPDVAKIDVEGAELDVLRGMQQTLAGRRKITLFVELNPACLQAAGHTPGELIGYLHDLGFSIALIDEQAGTITPLEQRHFIPPEDRPFWYGNLYCVRT